MSLLDRKAPHTVHIQKRVESRDTGGRRIWSNDGPRVATRCSVQPARDWSNAEEDPNAGLQIIDLRVVLSRQWVGDVNSHVYWEGDLYETIGAPQHFSVSPRTAHWRVTIRRIGVDPEA